MDKVTQQKLEDLHLPFPALHPSLLLTLPEYPRSTHRNSCSLSGDSVMILSHSTPCPSRSMTPVYRDPSLPGGRALISAICALRPKENMVLSGTAEKQW